MTNRSRNAGQEFSVGKDYIRKEKSIIEISQEKDNSIFMNFGFIKFISYFHNSYSINIYGMSSSSNSWIPAQTQLSESNNYTHSQLIMQDLYS